MEQAIFTFAPAKPTKRPKTYGKFAAATGLKPGTNEYKRAWAKANRERRLAHQRRYHETHTEQRREYGKRYRTENPEKRRATCKAWRENNPDHARKLKREGMHRARLRDPQKFVRRSAAWMKAHPETRNICRENRRARLLGRVTTAEWQEILRAHDGKCRYCGAPGRTMDHVVPISRGGRHEAANIVPACRPCNASKGNKMLSEWRGHPCRKSA